MMANRSKNNDDSFAQTFKPAVLLTGATMEQVLSRVYVREIKEDFDENDNQVMYTSMGHDGDPGNPDLKSIFSLEAANPDLNPYVRKVLVRRKEDFKDNSYLVELKPNGRGLAVLMMKDMPVSNQVHCNLRFLPFARLSDVLLKSSGDVLEINIPNKNVIKLNVTLKPSNTGEMLFKTHKTEVILDNTTEDQVVRLKKHLEFSGAQIVAHFSGLVLETTSNKDPDQMVAGFSLALNEAQDHQHKGWKKWVAFASTAGIILGGAAMVALEIYHEGGVSWKAGLEAVVVLSHIGEAAVKFLPDGGGYDRRDGDNNGNHQA